jgi:hypothetical protein
MHNAYVAAHHCFELITSYGAIEPSDARQTQAIREPVKQLLSSWHAQNVLNCSQ